MFFCAKKIVYLSLYEQEEKLRPGGFTGFYGGRENVRIHVQVQNAGKEKKGRYPVYLIAYRHDILLGDIVLEEGRGCFEKIFYADRNRMTVGSFCVEAEDIRGIRIELSENSQIKGMLKASSETGNSFSDIEQPEDEKCAGEKDAQADKKEMQEDIVLEAAGKETREPAFFFQENIPADKWEQLKRQFKSLHPFGDEREFISIELKDFVVLREKYQKLVNNSFLLHGFYNYRHLILGRDYKIGESTDICFYLGVPGVFFEREKMVAVMFGFEGFECAGPVEIGKFGYYLRQVEI